jgi:hypothetical protein
MAIEAVEFTPMFSSVIAGLPQAHAGRGRLLVAVTVSVAVIVVR